MTQTFSNRLVKVSKAVDVNSFIIFPAVIYGACSAARLDVLQEGHKRVCEPEETFYVGDGSNVFSLVSNITTCNAGLSVKLSSTVFSMDD